MCFVKFFHYRPKAEFIEIKPTLVVTRTSEIGKYIRKCRIDIDIRELRLATVRR